MSQYVYYKVTFYLDMYPYTGLDLPVIQKQVIGQYTVRVRGGGKNRWTMPEIKRAQWQATKLARCHPEMGEHIKRSDKWDVVDKEISSERKCFYEGYNGLYYYTIYLVKDKVVDTLFTP